MEQLPLFSLLLAASWLDLTTHKIPNWLTLPFILLALIYHGILGEGWPFALTGLVYALILLFPLFFFRLLAGGDVKLALGIGAFLGWKLFLEALLYGLVIGLPLVLVFAFYKVGWNGFKQTFMRYGYILGTKKYLAPAEGEMAGLKVPYGPALSLGALLTVALNHFNLFTLV
ncbi:A24 family peptidase [Zobellella maritima]|uniref:A24 family peptidase n=1 Tax=Zobellella maritima TaxID=2059725 RepID=UPI000E30619E|nr:A24 family peptidase [Zobellella maritima]